jgi:hypothetical protein
VRKIKYAVENDKRKMMDDEGREKKIKNANGERRAEKYGITTGVYLPMRGSRL